MADYSFIHPAQAMAACFTWNDVALSLGRPIRHDLDVEAMELARNIIGRCAVPYPFYLLQRLRPKHVF